MMSSMTMRANADERTDGAVGSRRQDAYRGDRSPAPFFIHSIIPFILIRSAGLPPSLAGWLALCGQPDTRNAVIRRTSVSALTDC